MDTDKFRSESKDDEEIENRYSCRENGTESTASKSERCTEAEIV